MVSTVFAIAGIVCIAGLSVACGSEDGVDRRAEPVYTLTDVDQTLETSDNRDDTPADIHFGD